MWELNMGPQEPGCLAPLSARPLSSCMTLGKSLHLCDLVSHLYLEKMIEPMSWGVLRFKHISKYQAMGTTPGTPLNAI